MYEDIFCTARILLNGLLKWEEVANRIISYLARELGENKILDYKLWTLTEGEDIAEIKVLAKDGT